MKMDVFWVHSGGIELATGEPSLASRLRLDELKNQLNARESKLGEMVVVFSGEETRKSGGGPQGSSLAAWWRRHGVTSVVKVYDTSMEEAYALLGVEFVDAKAVYFINDDVHMSRYLWQFAAADEGLAARIRPIGVPAVTSSDYRAAYPLDYMAAYNALAWLRLVRRKTGLWQFVLFGVDRALNKPTSSPFKRAILWVLNRYLRVDLRG